MDRDGSTLGAHAFSTLGATTPKKPRDRKTLIRTTPRCRAYGATRVSSSKSDRVSTAEARRLTLGPPAPNGKPRIEGRAEEAAARARETAINRAFRNLGADGAVTTVAGSRMAPDRKATNGVQRGASEACLTPETTQDKVQETSTPRPPPRPRAPYPQTETRRPRPSGTGPPKDRARRAPLLDAGGV